MGNWSPDGKSIGYGGYGHHDTPGLWILDVETGGVRQLSKGFFTMPEWSPDGTKLAVGLRLRDGFQVWMIDAKALPPATAEPNATAITPRFDDPKVQATSRGKLPRCLCSTGRTRQTRHRIPVSFGHVCRPADPRRSSRGNTDGTPLRRLERMFLSVPRGTGHIQADCREGPTFSAEKLANSCKRSRIRHRRRKIVSAFP